jgi:choline dehydrogenase-like flavoprotein
LLGRYAPPLPGLDLASATGRLWCRQGAVVREIEIDAAGRARGVAFHDQQSRSELRVQAPLVFLCASALESTRILLLSHAPQTGRAPGAASGALGRNLMDHMVVQATGIGGGLVGEPVSPEVGRCVYVPRFDARNDPAPMGDRGFGVQVYQSSGLPGRSYLTAVAFAEMFPHPENRVTLDPARRDAWGVPALHIECRHTPADLEAVSKMGGALHELANVVGAKLSELQATPPGAAMHECGTARMGDDPASSVLDRHNHCWDARGLYLTDAASFPSQGAQNPTLTIMALTARACDHAING